MPFRRAALAILIGLLPLAALPDRAEAGCQINAGLKNKGATKFQVVVNEAKVKSKGGTWRKLESGRWGPPSYYIDIEAGDSYSDVYNATFGCDAKRRYKFEVICDSITGSRTRYAFYYPSSNDWTERQTFTVRFNCP